MFLVRGLFLSGEVILLGLHSLGKQGNRIFFVCVFRGRGVGFGGFTKQDSVATLNSVLSSHSLQC